MTRCGRRIRPRIPRGPPRLPGLVEGAVRTEATRGLIRDDFPRLHGHVSLGTDADPVGDSFGYADHLEPEFVVRPGNDAGRGDRAPHDQGAAGFGLIHTAAIEAGRVADLLVLDANPLADIRRTRQIAAVYLRGVEIDRAALRARV